MATREFVSRLRAASISSLDALILRPYLGLFGEQVSERFVIVGTARVGSNFLLDGLKSSGSIMMYHEIFAEHNREIGQNFDQIFSTLFRKERKGIRIVGFKLFYNHLTREEWEKFSAHKEFKIIHLTRRNRLRAIVSLEIAFKTRRWTLSDHGHDLSLDRRRVSLDISNLLRRIQDIRDEEDHVRERFGDRAVLEVQFENLTARPLETYRQIGDFLGVTDIDPGHIHIRRQNPESLDRLIINYAEVHDLLQDTEFAEYLDG